MPLMDKELASLLVAHGAHLAVDLPIEPKFQPGMSVITHNINPLTHTRLPRYSRGKTGTVVRRQGIYPFPDTNAHGDPRMQHVYLIQFSAREIWGAAAGEFDTLCLDLWEEHLSPAP
jgi:hypothetical protein